jgi:hypothetical protein
MREPCKGSAPGIESFPGGGSDLRGTDVGRCCPTADPEATVLSFDLENDTALIPGILAQLMGVAERLRLFDDGTVQRMGVALHEAMLNGIHHGNLELDSSLRMGDERAYHCLAAERRRVPRYRRRRLHVAARFDPAGAVFVIRDEGRGFNPARLPDPTDVNCLERPSGRGLLLIHAFMDEVSYNTSGNQITLVKRRTNPPSRAGRPLWDQ